MRQASQNLTQNACHPQVRAGRCLLTRPRACFPRTPDTRRCGHQERQLAASPAQNNHFRSIQPKS
jgi:hypothetical protein